MTQPKPYYDDGKGIVIYNSDCREVLPLLGDISAVVTDPPYGISIQASSGKVGGSVLAANTVYPKFQGDDEAPDIRPLLVYSHVIIWGGNYFASLLPNASCWLVWDKRRGGPRNNFADCELAWTNLSGPARVFPHFWQGMLRESERGEHYHPTQKPVALMRWCLGFTPIAQVILDPFMGSGTTLVAAKQLGRKAIGIEIEERYCEVAVRRLAQEVMPL